MELMSCALRLAICLNLTNILSPDSNGLESDYIPAECWITAFCWTLYLSIYSGHDHFAST